ncbi:MAG: hypothetical protein AB4063_17400 [Crocosphaera sp.]
MSNLIIELLTLVIMILGIRSYQSQSNSESVMVRVPVNDTIRRR